MNRNTFSQTIEQLQNEFATVTENYSYLLERAVTNPEGGKWSPDYVQSIKPYCSEIEEKKPPLNSLYDTPESTGSDSFVLVLANLGQPELIREYYGEATFYDNLYFRNETEITRYQIYCSSGEVKPILIERLFLGEGGFPECYFVCANGNGQVITYEKEEGSVIACMYTLAGDALNETGRLRIIEEDGSVERIIDMVTDATVYDAGTVDKPLSELLSEYQDSVLKMIEEGLAGAAPEADDIQGMVLEYFPESPFPPSIGLPKLSEKSQWEGESPLWWFNAADMELFYECEFFNADRTDETLNAKLQEMEFEDVVQIAEEFYLTLSKRITTSEAIRNLVGAGENFFCTAHDYTAGTDPELLRKYLPEPVFQEIQAEVSSYEQAYEQSVRENEYNLLAEELMSEARSRVADIIDAHRSGSYEHRYGIGVRYSINPFDSTRNNGPAQFDIDEQLSRQNLAGIAPYYLAYDLVEGRIVAISSIREDVNTGATYFAYGDGIVEQFDVTAGESDDVGETLVGYRKLARIDDVKQECITVSRIKIEIDTYERDESSNSVKVSSLRKFLESNQDPTPVAYLAEYAQDGSLRKYTFHTPHEQPTINYDFAVEERLESSLRALATEYAGILVKLLQAKGELVGEIELSPYARYRFPFHIYICDDSEVATVDVGDEVLIQEHGKIVNDAMLKISERYEFPDVVLDSIFRNISERLIAKTQLKIAEKLGRWAALKVGLPRRLTSQATAMVH